MRVKLRGQIESAAILPGCGKKGPMTAAAKSQIQGEAVFVFKVFVIMWIISEDKVRLYSGETEGGDGERE